MIYLMGSATWHRRVMPRHVGADADGWSVKLLTTPHPWVFVITRKGKSFYWNAKTDEYCWCLPLHNTKSTQTCEGNLMPSNESPCLSRASCMTAESAAILKDLEQEIQALPANRQVLAMESVRRYLDIKLCTTLYGSRARHADMRTDTPGTSSPTHSDDHHISSAQAEPGSSDRFSRRLASSISSCQNPIDLSIQEDSEELFPTSVLGSHSDRMTFDV